MEDSAADHGGIEEAREGHDEIKDWSLVMLESSLGRSMRRHFKERIFAGERREWPHQCLSQLCSVLFDAIHHSTQTITYAEIKEWMAYIVRSAPKGTTYSRHHKTRLERSERPEY